MRDRGFLHQCTDLSGLDAILHDAESSSSHVDDNDDDDDDNDGGVVENDGTTKTKAISAYLGFDATADSLHVGSLLQIMILRHLQNSGHRPIVLVGGGTSKVGDPTGKDESRMLLTDDVIRTNTDGISRVFRKFLSFGPEHDDDEDHGRRKPNDAIMVNNDEWLSSLKYLQFLRDYGTHFTINRMLGFESVKQRLSREAPFSFLEFNYMILQAYDFLELYRRHGALLQLGGSDQWGNMISGVELGRRVDSVRLYALTAPLITTNDGKKMGKTAGGAVWLNADRLSEYDYWQFWRNTDDSDVIRFLKLFTELPLEDIRKMESWTGANVNKAKIVLADEATALLHGRECLRGIRDTVDGMFGGGGAGGGGGEGSTEGLNRVYVTEDDVGGGTDGAAGGVKIADLFVRLGLASSKKEAKRLIAGGGARIGETKITDENATLGMEAFADGSKEVTLRAGKKRAGVVELGVK
jgi:tyrosyl-tRNA synthetase